MSSARAMFANAIQIMSRPSVNAVLLRNMVVPFRW
jgi:hypothetical protein